ncbi:MAG: hypothetical protein LC105_01040 [Chitinophagales bacterium]|nr:hypothetical protein [Chitinophagales bacterium]
MNENILQQLYKGKYSPIKLLGLFFGLNILLVILIVLFKIKPVGIWIGFQTILLLYSTTSLIVGALSDIKAILYYPLIILGFIIFYLLGKNLAQILSDTTIGDFEYLKNFILLNFLYFSILTLLSNIYRKAKKTLENM